MRGESRSRSEVVSFDDAGSHQSTNLFLTDEKNQERPEARVERRLDRNDLSDDEPRVPLELAPPHRTKRKKKKVEEEQ